MTAKRLMSTLAMALLLLAPWPSRAEEANAQNARAGNPPGVIFGVIAAASGVAEWREETLRYVLLHGGGEHPRLGYVPPMGLRRSLDGGAPWIQIADPKTKGPLRVNLPTGGVATFTDPGCLARAVMEGQVPPGTPVQVSLEFEFHDSIGLKARVACSALDQLNEAARADLIKAHGFPGARELLKRVTKLPVELLVIRCISPGLEDVSFPLRQNPNLAQRLTLQAVAPAAFVAQLHSPEGAGFRVDFSFVGSNLVIRGRTSVQQVVDGIARAFVDEHGKGASSARQAPRSESWEILVTRESYQEHMKDARWRERISIEASDPTVVAQLLQLVQQMDTDVFAVDNRRVQDFIERNYQWREALNQYGKADFWEKVDSSEKFSDRESEQANAFLKLAIQKKGHSLGIAAIIPKLDLPIAFNSDSEEQDATESAAAQKKREAAMEFLRAVSKHRATGDFPIPPTVDLLLVASDRLKHDVVKMYEFKVLEDLGPLAASSHLFSARSTADWDRPGPDDSQEMEDLEALLARYRPEPPVNEQPPPAPRPKQVTVPLDSCSVECVGEFGLVSRSDGEMASNKSRAAVEGRTCIVFTETNVLLHVFYECAEQGGDRTTIRGQVVRTLYTEKQGRKIVGVKGCPEGWRTFSATRPKGQWANVWSPFEYAQEQGWEILEFCADGLTRNDQISVGVKGILSSSIVVVVEEPAKK